MVSRETYMSGYKSETELRCEYQGKVKDQPLIRCLRFGKNEVYCACVGCEEKCKYAKLIPTESEVVVPTVQEDCGESVPEQVKQEQIDDYLMWVGGNYYSLESFVKEAKSLGICRRVSFIPKNLKVGVSRVFLISDMSDEDRKAYQEEIRRRDAIRYRQWKKKVDAKEEDLSTSVKGIMPRGIPQVFAYFVVKGIAYIVKPGTDIPEELAKRGVTSYDYVEGGFGSQDERGCGSLVIGGTYLLSEEDLEKVKDMAESGNVEGGNIIEVLPPVRYLGKRFRGLKSLPHSQGNDFLKVE